MTGESGAGMGTLLDDRTLVGFDRETVWSEDRVLSGKLERSEYRALLMQIDGHAHVVLLRSAFQRPQGATDRNTSGDLLELVETIETAMSRNRTL
jgi:hypothetical protein